MSANRWDNRPKATESKPVATAEPSIPKSDVELEISEKETDPEKFYMIAKGCQLVTRRGVLSSGDCVSISDFVNGQTQFDAHIATGFLVER